jgi:SAM-dependent methyltransferase
MDARITMSADHFSTQSASYAQFRPTYPEAWFEWLMTCVTGRKLAWDCACGSGQATLALAPRFEKVIATDLSAQQITHAPAVPNVDWRVAQAEISGLPDGSMDLVTVAQALHWFDLSRFWPEVQRVLRPGGVVAVWSYGVLRLPNEELQAMCDDFYENVVGEFWPPERRIVEAGYGALEFPFEEITAPAFDMQSQWSLDALLGYFSSWSATARYVQAHAESPIPSLREKLLPLWAAEGLTTIRWPLSVRVGRGL